MPISDTMDLSEKKAVVTGGAKGIGSEICVCLAKYGANISILDKMNSRNTIKKVEKVGTEAISFKTDVTNPKQVKSSIEETLREYGQIDILVNNAGICPWTNFENTDLNEWNRVMKTNILGYFLVTKEVLKNMKDNKTGKIVFIGSIAGQVGGYEASPAYSVSKGGVHTLVKSVAKIGAPHIYSNGVAPGVIKTEMSEEKGFPEDYSLLKRQGEPEDVAEVVAFLASPASNFITGEIISVSGGRKLT